MLSIDTNIKSGKNAGNRELDILFGSRTRVDVLWAFIGNPDRNFGPRELERICKRPYEEVRRITAQLYDIGLVRMRANGVKESSGQQGEIIHRAYYLNKNHPWVKPLRLLLEREFGVIKEIENKLKELESISVAFVIGSFARGEQKPESDVDLVVIGKHSLEILVEPLSEVERRMDREIQIFTYTPSDWRKKLKQKDHFAVSIMETEKIFLVGNDERLAGISS
ncbi:MAG TPA: nucleotidyltransferase domain-containing protein [Firmicutes bacterium]|nr:nucleotidyltransferase domain-containing protein [Bacillota bacterium]